MTEEEKLKLFYELSKQLEELSVKVHNMAYDLDIHIPENATFVTNEKEFLEVLGNTFEDILQDYDLDDLDEYLVEFIKGENTDGIWISSYSLEY